MNPYSIDIYENINNKPILKYHNMFYADSPSSALTEILKVRTNDDYGFEKTQSANQKLFARVQLMEGAKNSTTLYNLFPKIKLKVRINVTLNYSFTMTNKYSNVEMNKYAAEKFEDLDSGAVIVADGANIDILPVTDTASKIVISTTGYFYLLIKAISKEDAIKQVEEKEIPTGEYELTGKTIADMQQIQ